MVGTAATPVAQGKDKVFIVKKETTRGVSPVVTTGARVKRRTSGTLTLRKEEVQSNEKRDDFQVADSRHGTKTVNGTLAQELWSDGSTEEFEVFLMKDFVAVTSIDAGADDDALTCASSVISRPAGSFATDGLRIGHVVRFTGLGTNAANRNWLVVAMANDGLSFTVAPVDGGAAMADWASDTSGSIVIPGKRTFIPTTGHTAQSLCIEENNRALDSSKVNTGIITSSLGLRIQPNGMVTLDWGLIGLDQFELSGAEAPYYTSPAGAGLGRAFSSAKGVIRKNGAAAGVVTGLSLDLANGAQPLQVVMAETSPDTPLGRALTVTGQFTGAVKDRSNNTLFRNETEFGLTMVLEAPSVGGGAPEFFAFDLPRVKVNSQDEDDPDGAIIETVAIRALLCAAATGRDATTISVQDSTLV